MKIKRSVLEQIIREELASHIREMMNEAPKDDKDKKDFGLVDANAEKKGKEKKGGKGEEKPTTPQGGAPEVKGKKTSPNQADKPKDKTVGAKELPVPKEPEADPELEKDVAGENDPGEEEDAADITGSKIANEVSGKTIQSITMEPKSKLLPGAQEITLTFREIQDPLKILITKSGAVKFHFKGLHNEL